MYKLKKIFIPVFLGLSLVIQSQALAFTFDKWESGITLRAAKVLASQNAIYLNEPDVKTTPQFNKQYAGQLFNVPVIVRMYFSKNEKKLYMLTVRWEQQISGVEAKMFATKLSRILESKYGQSKTLKGNTRSYKNGALCEDKIRGYQFSESHDTISLYHSEKCELVVLSYTDESVKQQDEEWLKTEEGDMEDANKL